MALLTLQEAAERLRVGPKRLRVLITAGKIKTIKLGPRTSRIDERDIDDFIERARST